MRKSITAFVLSGALALSACQTTTGGEWVDAGSTAAALWTGKGVEANPIWSWCGKAAPICVLGGKALIKEAAIKAGASPDEIDKGMDNMGWAAGCFNVANVFAGASIGASVILGAVCYWIAKHQWEQRERERLAAAGTIPGRREEDFEG